MKKISLLLVMLFVGNLYAQRVQPEPNFGLAMSATGLSFFTIPRINVFYDTLKKILTIHP